MRTDEVDLFVVVIEGSKFETDVKIYHSLGDALRSAQEHVRKDCERLDTYFKPGGGLLNESMRRAGWLWYGSSHDDGVSVRVIGRRPI